MERSSYLDSIACHTVHTMIQTNASVLAIRILDPAGCRIGAGSQGLNILVDAHRSICLAIIDPQTALCISSSSPLIVINRIRCRPARIFKLPFPVIRPKAAAIIPHVTICEQVRFLSLHMFHSCQPAHTACRQRHRTPQCQPFFPCLFHFHRTTSHSFSAQASCATVCSTMFRVYYMQFVF